MLRLMSNNVWNCDNNCPDWAARGMDCSAPVRARVLAGIYASLAPDVIGMQEMTNLMTRELTANLREKGLNYAVLWGNFTPVFFRPDRLEVCDTVYFPFPEHYEGYEGIFNDVGSKSCCTALFRVKESGKYFIFSTAHLWWKSSDPASKSYQHGSDEVRAIQADMAVRVLTGIQEKYRCPLVFVGDFNTDYDSKAMRMVMSRGFRHGHDIASEYACAENGYHWCGPDGYVPYEPKPFERAIDHIVCRDFPEGAVRRFDRATPECILPVTDHSPVWIDAEW